MLSKLTFSLAFVVMLIFTISFLATPVMAQTDALTFLLFPKMTLVLIGRIIAVYSKNLLL